MNKKIILLITICLVAILSVGCSNVQSTLGVPEKVRIENGILKWNSVAGANKYAVYIDGNEAIVTADTSYNLSSENLVCCFVNRFLIVFMKFL